MQFRRATWSTTVIEAIPDLPARPAGLPRYGNPPLREVAIAIVFQPLFGMTQGHVGQYWSLIRDRYPRSLDQPPIDPLVEGDDAGRPLFQFTIGPPPLRRSWFISDDDERLVQLQSDRFVHNWRGQGSDYPHLDDLWRSFAERYVAFANWVNSEEIGTVEPYQLEVTYLNVISGESLSQILQGLNPPQADAFAEDISGPPLPRLELRYPIAGTASRGSLYLHAFEREPNTQQVELTYRAALRSSSLDSLAEQVATARRLIVTHFTALTRTTLHEGWERRQ
jgi:hypothetical protein